MRKTNVLISASGKQKVSRLQKREVYGLEDCQNHCHLISTPSTNAGSTVKLPERQLQKNAKCRSLHFVIEQKSIKTPSYRKKCIFYKNVYILVNCFYPPKHYYNVLPSRILWWKSIQNSGIIESYIKMRFYKKVHFFAHFSPPNGNAVQKCLKILAIWGNAD